MERNFEEVNKLDYSNVLRMDRPKNVQYNTWESMKRCYRVMWLAFDHKTRFGITRNEIQDFIHLYRHDLGYRDVDSVRRAVKRYFNTDLKRYFMMSVEGMEEELARVHDAMSNRD